MSPVAMDGDSPYPVWKQDPHATKSPASSSPPPKPTTPPASTAPQDSGHSWTIWSGGPAVVVSGGTVSVNTSDLDSLASSLTSAAGTLDDARTLIANVVTEVNEAPAPPVSPPSVPYPILGGFDLEKSVALQALDALTTGPGSLEAVAGTLRGIASDVTACSQAHALADGKATPVNGLVGPVDVRAFDSGLLKMALGSVAIASQFPTIATLLASSPATSWLLYELVKDNEDGQAAVEALQLLLSDPTTEQWVKEDLVRIVLLTRWLKNAKTGREAATVQAYLQQVSQRLDPWAKQRLPGQVAVGTQTVDTTSLTPMQRVAMVLGANAAAIGAGVYGTQSGVTVTPVGGTGSTVLPPAAKDPFGLASAVNPGMTGKGKEAKSPQSISETITHCQEVQSSKNSLGQGYEEAGVISIQRVEHADGRVSWVVYVPGTTDWTVGDGEPQDLLTNLEAITTVLTAGAPTAGADIPDDVHALHLENTGDAVPGLDAAPTPTGPNRQVAMLDTHQTSTNGYPHASSAYAQAAEGLEDKAPELADWNKSFSRASGAGEQGTTTTEYTFAVQRNTDPNGIYKGGATYRGKVPSAQPSYPRPTPSPQSTGEH